MGRLTKMFRGRTAAYNADDKINDKHVSLTANVVEGGWNGGYLDSVEFTVEDDEDTATYLIAEGAYGQETVSLKAEGDKIDSDLIPNSQTYFIRTRDSRVMTPYRRPKGDEFTREDAFEVIAEETGINPTQLYNQAVNKSYLGTWLET